MNLLKLVSVLAIIFPIAAQNSHMFLKNKNNNYEFKNNGIKNQNVTQSKDEVEVNFRIPKAFDPISYFIRLQPFVNGDKSTTGYTEIVFAMLENTNSLILHMENINYDKTSFLLEILDGSGDTVEFIRHSYDADTELYEGLLSKILLANKEYRFSMKYKGIINRGYRGFYQSSYINENGEEVELATTQFEPTYARRAFPCFDEPSLKATFQVEIGRENSYALLSNTPLISSRPIEGFDGWTWDLFDVTPVMTSYLVAFIISDLVNISTITETGVEINTWSRPALIQFGQYSLDVIPQILTFFEKYFEIPYPLTKQDQVAVPDFRTAAMENWGVNTYREEYLLWDPVLDSTTKKRLIVETIAHELAHIWVGNFVTLEWWNDLWLNEGFATYFGFVGADLVEPDMDLMIEFVSDTMQPIFITDASESSIPVSWDIKTHDDIGDMSNPITYSKGGSLVRMMEYFLTHETFHHGMKNYINENIYGNAAQDDLLTHLNDQAQLDGTLDPSLNVKDIMKPWLLQSGFPLITVTINGDGTALLTQERYLNPPNPNSTETWWVPVSYASDNINLDFDSFPIFWMSPSDLSLTITGLSTSSTWHIFNMQQAYYYRVNYDDSTWNGIAQHLENDYSAVDPRNRAQILDDSFTLAEAGRLGFDIPFSISSYLHNENHYVPWKSFLSNMVYIEQMLSRTVAYSGLRNYLGRILYPVYDLVGAIDNSFDANRIIFLRNQIFPWACDILYQPCLDSASQQFDEWMCDPDNYSIISPNLKSDVYCTAVREGSEEEWRFSLDRYQTTTRSEEKDFLLFAMACSQDRVILLSYLDLIYNGNGEIPKISAAKAFSNIATTDSGRDIAWDYLMNNYHAIAEFHDGSYQTVQYLAGETSREFNTKKDLIEITTFRDLLISEGINTEILDSAVDTVKYNIAWMEKNYDIIAGWLFDNDYGII